MSELNNIHPGEVLIEEFLKPMSISAYRLAKETNVPQMNYPELKPCTHHSRQAQ